MFGSLGFTELVLILIIVLIIFGAGKLPQLGEGVGKAIKGFKKSVHEADAIEAEAQALAAEQQQTQPTVGAQPGQPVSDPGQVNLQAAPESSADQMRPVSPAQATQAEPAQTTNKM
mgnify:CR=1 FL=1